MNDVGVFYDPNGNAKSQSTINFQGSPTRGNAIVWMAVHKHYLVVLREAFVNLFSTSI
jgi:hypothetical protein